MNFEVWAGGGSPWVSGWGKVHARVPLLRVRIGGTESHDAGDEWGRRDGGGKMEVQGEGGVGDL